MGAGPGAGGETRCIPIGFNIGTPAASKGFLAKNLAVAGSPLAISLQ